MKTILAHFKKDAASFRPLLWIWMICIGVDCLAFLDRVPFPHASKGGGGLVIVAGLILFVASRFASLAFQVLSLPFLIVGVMHSDPLTEPNAFWRTRPIARSALLAEKSLFILLLLAGAILAAIATRFHAQNNSGMATLQQLMVFVSVLMAFASVTSNFSKLILTFLGIGLGAGVLASMVLGCARNLEVISWNLFHFPMTRHLIHSTNPDHAGTSVLLLGGSLVVVVHQYLTLKTNISQAILFTTIFLALLLHGG